MEKFSKWRDPSTGIQPFLPLTTPSSPLSLILLPLITIFGLARALLLTLLYIIYFVLVEILLSPLGSVVRPLTSLIVAFTARVALFSLGYYWIPSETASAKRGSKGVAQIFPSSPRKGDLIISNWTSYIDVLYLAFRHNPTFLLPVFSEPATTSTATTTAASSTGSSFGRSTGTGSASILLPTSTSTCVGYTPVRASELLGRTGSLPPIVTDLQPSSVVYTTLTDARRASPNGGPIVLFPEGTTSNGRAVLRFCDGVLAEDVGKDDGIVWIQFIRHAAATALVPAASCPIPSPLAHLRSALLTLPLPRTMSVRTLHPSASPSSPSFLPSEVLAGTPNGLAAVRDERAAWREACAIVLAETGRVRRVPGMGWVEKSSFLEYFERSKKQGR